MSSGATAKFQKRKLIRPVYLPSFLFTAAEGAMLPVLPVTAIALGLDLASAGALIGAMMIGALLAELPAAMLNTRIGERRSMLLASWFGGAITVLPFFGLGLAPLIIAAVGFGAAHSLFGLARHSLMGELVPPVNRARAMSILGGMFRGGLAAGPIIGAAVISLAGVDATYLAAAVMCLLAGLVVVTVPAETMVCQPSGQNGNAWAVAKRERAKLSTLGVASAIIAGARTIRLIGLPLLAIHIGLDAATSALVIGVTGIIDFSLFYLAGIIMDRYGRFWGSVPTLLVLGFLYLGTFLVDNLWAFVAFATLSALANAFSAGINMVLGVDLAPEGSRSEFLASFRLLTSGGVALAPVAIVSITAFAGLSAGLAVTGLINFYGAWLFWKYLPIYSKSSK